MSADRVEVRLVIASDGSVGVTETTVFRFAGGPFTSVTRQLSTSNTDGIVDVAAAVDGVPYPVGRQAGHVRIEHENGVTVTWRLLPLSDTSRTLTLTYRVRGAVRREAAADVVSWRALPIKRSYEARAVTVVTSWPAGAALTAIRQVSNGKARVSGDGRRATIVASEALAPGIGLDFTLAFAPLSLAREMAAWQLRQERGRAAAPSIAMGAGAILLAGFAWLLVFSIGHRREAPPGGDAAPRTTPPDGLSVALAAALMGPGAGADWSQALATLVDLAARGMVRIDEEPGRTWHGSREYVIRLVGRPSGLRAHEAGLLDLLFMSKDGPVASVKLSAAGRAAQTRLKVFKLPVSEELVAAGLVSPDRAHTREALVRWGLLLVVLAATGFIGAALLIRFYGGWPLLVPGAVMLIAVTILIVASRFSVMSAAGQSRALPWRSFFAFVRGVARGHKSIADPAWFATYLPFAVARGVGHQWVRTFEKAARVTGPPSWFTPAPAPPGSRTPLGQLADMLSRAQSAGTPKHAST